MLTINAPDDEAPARDDVPEVATPFDRSTAVSARAGHVAAAAAHVDSPSQSSIPRDSSDAQRRATPRHAPLPRAAEYEAARDRFGTVNVWTAKDLSDVLRTEVRTAQETIADWKRAELLDETRLGRYRFRDQGGRS